MEIRILLGFFLSACICLQAAAANEHPKLYIVYMGAADESTSHLLSGHHAQLLASVSNSSVESAMDSIVYSYNRAINGFAAAMLPSQASMLRQMPGVVSVFEDYELHLQTSRSMNFLGLEDGSGQTTVNSLWKKTKGENMIIGVIDSGIWPESPSFSDSALPNSIPSKWRGACITGNTNFTCNRKVIGARYYGPGTSPPISPRDVTGHGSHVASIAAGAPVSNVDDQGFARGTVKGVAPMARIAAYKICWTATGCQATSALKAWDDAIDDGVDVINYSVNPTSNLHEPYYRDVSSIGSFHAVQKGIVVVACAGNTGPASATVKNTTPWKITVAASGTDRRFQSNVVLGDGSVYQGSTTTNFDLKNNYYSLEYGGNIPSSVATPTASGECAPRSLDRNRARGKIILCDPPTYPRDFINQTDELNAAGATGYILGNNAVGKERLLPRRFAMPGTQVGNMAANAIRAYIRSTSNPVATIQKPTTLVGQKPSPMMWLHSSQGPNAVVPNILKPDVTAPGMYILAAWSPMSSTPQNYFMESGTSMASPHVAGLSALLKSLHPDWSPAAIKSAIMTTAYTLDNTGKPILDGDQKEAGPFNYGSGHIDTTAAADPGLVYNAGESDYVTLMCNIGFTSNQIQTITGKAAPCPTSKGSASDLNYPSVTLASLTKGATVTRTLTSVSDSPSTYNIQIKQPQGISVTSNPAKLTFSKKGDQRTFTLSFVVQPGFLRNQYVYGDYVWNDGKHSVRSPIVVRASSTVTEEQLVFTT